MIGVTFLDRHSFLYLFIFIFFQAGATPVLILTSVLLFSSEVSKHSGAGLRASFFPNNTFFPIVFFPNGLDTMQLYFHRGIFPHDFLSLQPPNRTATSICQQSEQLGLTPSLAFLERRFAVCFNPFPFSAAELSMTAWGLFFQLLYFA